MYINIDAATTEVMTKTLDTPATTGIVTVVTGIVTVVISTKSNMKKMHAINC